MNDALRGSLRNPITLQVQKADDKPEYSISSVGEFTLSSINEETRLFEQDSSRSQNEDIVDLQVYSTQTSKSSIENPFPPNSSSQPADHDNIPCITPVSETDEITPMISPLHVDTGDNDDIDTISNRKWSKNSEADGFEEQLRLSMQLLKNRASNSISIPLRISRITSGLNSKRISSISGGDETVKLELWKIKKQYTDVVTKLSSQLGKQSDLKAKSMRKCAYLEKTVSDLKRSMAETNINCNLWKQKYQKIKTQNETLKHQNHRIENEMKAKSKLLKKRESSVKRQFQSVASLNAKYEIEKREKEGLKDAFDKMTIELENVRRKTQKKRMSDHQLTLELNRNKMKIKDLKKKYQEERANMEALKLTLENENTGFMLQMERQKVSYLKRLRDAFSVIDEYERQMLESMDSNHKSAGDPNEYDRTAINFGLKASPMGAYSEEKWDDTQ